MEDPDQGLFGRPARAERDACGVGFVASRTGTATHGLLEEALGALACMEHRGACGADPLTGDGAGVMTDIPWELLGFRKGEVAVASLFLPQDYARRVRSLNVFTSTMEYHGLEILTFRDVPVDPTVLGEEAARCCPAMVHAIVKRPAHCRTDLAFDRLLYTVKQEVRSRQSDQGINHEFFFTSLSGSTIVYKALTRSDALDRFYLDLKDPRYRTRFALFHRRFSTNTRTSWDKAQPFRRIAHNGEINTIAGNRSWAHSRERHMGLRRDQILTRTGISDSGSLNEMVEALLYRSAIPHIEDILAIMMPPAPAGARSEFYTFWSRAMEPWDGPAIILYSDGNTVGARLDRHGFRPSRWALTEEAFYLSSEAGAFAVDEERIQRKGTLHAGKGVKVDLDTGRVHFRDASLSRENRDAHFDARTLPMQSLPFEDAPVDLETRILFSFTEEEQERLLYPMAAEGREPIGSMGDTARPNVFSLEPRPFFDYFYQNFAQVTNPPLDYLREENVTDLRVFLGRKPNIFFPKDLLPLEPAVEAAYPVLSLGEMRYLESLARRTPSTSHIIPRTFPMTFPRTGGPEGFRPAVERLVADVLRAVEQRCTVIVLSDRDADYDHPPIPGLIALRAVVSALNHSGLRLDASIVVETGEARTPHHVAALLSFGASAVCPSLALRIARGDEHRLLKGLDPDQRERNFVKALVSGLLKILAKSGISVIQSYISAKLFTAIGLGDELMEKFFPGNASPIGGIGYLELAGDVLQKTALCREAGGRLGNTWQFREDPRGQGGEVHAMTTARARLVHQAVDGGPGAAEAWRAYLAAGEASAPISVRHLFDLKPLGEPIALEEVEPAPAILARFGAGAMSFGAVSAESQRDLILAMREVGGRSNSGEGGENPYYYTDGITATTKQVASARFGVNAEYLVTGRELQIKVAQGAKPGEGGQLMAVKVDASIARARFSMPGVDLISPPPLHDIYSIEDLKELIYELRQVHPGALISVKLVSGVALGTIAVGVAKAGADILYIAGGDGGTGAATLGSMKHAGLPVEFGLAEAHRALAENGLRGQVELRADGALLTGRDIVVAALLGAEGFDFGKLLLVAEGCIMARVCEKNTCPAGIATHDPKYKARYRGSKDQVVRLLRHLAEDVRAQLAAMGARTLGELAGRTDLLATSARHAEWLSQRKLHLDRFLVPPTPFRARGAGAGGEEVSPLNRRILEDALKGGGEALAYPISTRDRAVLATLSGRMATPGSAPLGPFRFTFQGSAGQGFGVFLVDGIEAVLFGEGNDSVAKGMGGGRIVVRPWARSSFAPEENAIIGNCALYGATGGTLHVHGLAGDRFAVRNSGATAVAEGAGLHACEYMTRGTVAFLGRISGNAGAGMTGGKIFVDRQYEACVNANYVRAEALDEADALEFRLLLEDYAGTTSSRTALALLEDWGRTRERFAKFVPYRL
ncbi:glutamate synthase large subunit [Mesoterricola silvestris]|uniref:Glutamate synthase n=1 Tax=Mesoterricola silvestris TaxID=2927979 RepID=A0AA48GTX4_9BACT|nr:glutamate synthase large subunit [Mesoterricola silvestris]BDU74295.1 glutamate synthase [Mesoterricola silvestris]